MMSHIKNLSLVVLVVGSFAGCGYLGSNSPMRTGAGPTPLQKADLSFESVKAAVFSRSCNGCHGSSGGVNLETYESVMRNLEMIERTVFVTKTMPKGFLLTRDQEAILKQWIDIGAPEEAGAAFPTPDPVPSPSSTPISEELEAKFESIQANIISKRCIFCHSIGGSAKHIPLATLEDFIDSPREIVIPGNPDESGIMIAIERSDEKRMPPQSSGPALTNVEISIIREWIINGANDVVEH